MKSCIQCRRKMRTKENALRKENISENIDVNMGVPAKSSWRNIKSSI